MTAARASRRTALLLALSAGACTGLLAVPAHAAGAGIAVTPAAVSQNWWWAESTPTPGGMPLPAGVPAAPPAASGVPDGALGVGYMGDSGGAPDKVAALAFDLDRIPLDSVFSTFTVAVPLDKDANQVANGNPAVSACENIASFTDGPGAQDIAKAPAISALSCLPGKFDAKLGTKGGYVFDITSFANDWAGGSPSYGISLRPTKPATGNPEPFSLSLAGKNLVLVRATYVAPVVAPVATPPATTGSGAGPTTGGATGGSTPQLAPAPALGSVSGLPGASGLPDVAVPGPLTAPNLPAALPAPVSGVAPQVAGPAAVAPTSQALSLRPVAVFGSLRPTAALWLGALAVLVLLGLTALSLGDPMAPAPADPRRRRFAEVVGGGATTRRQVTRRPAPPRSRFASIRPA